MTGVNRQAYDIKRLHLTPFVIKMPYGCKTAFLKKAWNQQEISQKWESSAWAKRLQNKEKVIHQTCQLSFFQFFYGREGFILKIKENILLFCFIIKQNKILTKNIT